MRLTVTAGTTPRTFSGTAKQRGVQIWVCNHAHPTQAAAAACGAAQAELMRECEDVRCLACHQPVDNFLEHYSPARGEYECRTKNVRVVRTTTRKRSW